VLWVTELPVSRNLPHTLKVEHLALFGHSITVAASQQPAGSSRQQAAAEAVRINHTGISLPGCLMALNLYTCIGSL
jgi:hypothetical protein